MLLFCVRVRVFLAQKKTPKYENSEQNKPYYLHALLPNKARWCILHVWFENATTFTRQHPSIHRTTTHYYYYRIETPTTIAGVKRSRERER